MKLPISIVIANKASLLFDWESRRDEGDQSKFEDARKRGRNVPIEVSERCDVD